jgi:GT2 family glycosyltransferase
MRITLVVLTFNRKPIVQRALTQVISSAGVLIDEFVYVDNGSSDGVEKWVVKTFKPDVIVLNKVNLGVAKGYNRGFALATGEWIVLTGCDMLMPTDWLLKMKTAAETIPRSGVVCIFSHRLADVPERIRGPERIVKGIKIQPVIPLERRLISRELLGRVGYLREDFGLYGWEDVEWAERCFMRCKEAKLLPYVLPDDIAEHLGTEGVSPTDGKDPTEYHAFKAREVDEPYKKVLLQECRHLRYPYYNPFV